MLIPKLKNSGLIPHWKMSVSYRNLKFMMRIQELGSFEYTPLSISLKHFLLSSCVCVKILSILKKNSDNGK